MIIETDDNLLKCLNLGCFPKDVLDFQDSQDFLHQLVFVDYQLQLLIQNEFDGTELVPATTYHENASACQEKLVQLIGYVELVASNFNDVNKEYQEKLYCAVLLAHLYYLNSQTSQMHEILTSITVNNSYYNSPSMTRDQNLFLNYLICRYNVLTGVSANEYVENDNSYKLWIEYLLYKEKPFFKSEMAANHWLEILLKYLTLKLSNQGNSQLGFSEVCGLKFKSNTNLFIRYCNYLVNYKDKNGKRIVDKHFWTEYSQYLNQLIVNELKSDAKSFPNADENADIIENLVISFYSTIGRKHRHLIHLKTSKRYLISLTERTYQSQVVLSQLIRILIEMDEYDEALAAFKTFMSYVDKEKQINNGHIHDILSIVEIYSLCLEKFNPLNSIKHEKFKYNTTKLVVEILSVIATNLLGYLDILKTDCNLTYDDDDAFKGFQDNDLSFLYNKYNINVLLSDHSQFIHLISSGWFSLGYLYYYYLAFETPNQEMNTVYRRKLLTYYKNALIVNSTGDINILFNYALALSYMGHLGSSLKLCKFILKKYPESFKTWNLLALVKSVDSPEELEKFINSALNIAGIYIIKCSNDEVPIPTRTKTDIIQLKLTQLSIWEKIYGTTHITEFLSEVFILFYELFNVKFEEQINNGSKNYLIDSKWSHRPSFIDPKYNNDQVLNNTKKQHAKNNIKRISKVNQDQQQLKPAGKETINEEARKILSEIWLWTSKIYFKLQMLEESELCIIESENIYKPNVKTYVALGYLTSKHQKFLSLQEFEKSLEKLEEFAEFDKLQYLENLLGISKLFLVDDTSNSSLFISVKDLNGGWIRLKNYLENFINCWPLGQSPEVYYFLSLIYEKIDDKVLLNKCLKRCIELEDLRPVRNFFHCDDNFS